MPDRRAAEAVDLLYAELRGGPRGVLHPLGRPRADALGLAVAVDLRRQDRAVALVDPVAHRLADEVRADRPHVQVVALEDLLPRAAVRLVRERLVDLEVVAPARELEPVEAPAASLLGQVLERQVGPLAAEQRDRSRHAERSYDA